MHVRSVLATHMYMYMDSRTACFGCVALVLNDSIPAYSPISLILPQKEFVDMIPIAKPLFCTCSTFICKDGHALTCKPDAIFIL